MPGRLLNMATNGANDSGAKHAINGKAVSPSPATAGRGAVQQPTSDSDAGSIIPGLPSGKAMTNGDITHAAYPTPNGVSPSSPARGAVALPDSMYDLPEEVVHIATDLHSLGALIQRVSAECFHSLEHLVDDLAKIPIPSAPPMTNGASSHPTPPLSSSDERDNVKKKKLMLNFASDYRAKFIKLLVVTYWTQKDVQDVSKLIDLKGWLYEQDDAAQRAGNSFLQAVAEIRPFKLPNPDLETALAVLSGGDVPWVPHLGFREQKKLEPEEILKVLHQMNTIINLRLVLHEELIPQLRDYRIGDGRATFTFPQEFELDVYVASEDHTQPWYFLDVRFLFDPAPNITGDQLRAMIDSRINAALAEKGLRGACELAHDFVLTHKINIFQKQARELQRGVWANALGVDLVRRTLTVQYWVESPQAKSWIEIGVVSGKDKKRRRKADNAISSRIKARWIRNGQAQEAVDVPINLGTLSLEDVVRAHIARHSSHILTSVRDALEEKASKHGANEERSLRLKLACSDTEPSDCALHARIADHPSTTLQIDGITGRLYFSPAGPATPKAQEALERAKDPIAESPEYLSRYLTYEIQMRIDRLIEVLGWEPMRHIKLTKDEIQTRMKREVHRWSLFQPRGFKGSNWYIAYAINLCGESWWALEMYGTTALKVENSITNSGNRPPPSTARTTFIPATNQLRMPGANTDNVHVPLTLVALKSLEKSAALAAAFVTSNRALHAKGVPTALQQRSVKKSSPTDSTASTSETLPTLMIRFSELLKSRSGSKNSFASELLQLQFLGFDSDVGEVRLVAKGKMRDPERVQDILLRTKAPGIKFALDGSFAMVVDTKVGANATGHVVARLTTLETLCNLARTLRSHAFECKEISFSKVCFTYAGDQEVTLRFLTSPTPRIKLDIPDSNPARRVQALLEEIVNDPDVGFSRFTMALEYFLPVLRGFQTLEARHAADMPGHPTILPRQVDYYRLMYPDPQSMDSSKPLAVYDMHFKRNKDEMEWRVSDVLPGPAREEREKMLPGFHAKVGELMKRVGSGWTGMRTLLVADKGGIEEAILELDRVVWEAIGEGRKRAEELAAEVESKPVKQEVITID